jgi:hypothetical protein
MEANLPGLKKQHRNEQDKQKAETLQWKFSQHCANLIK